MCLRQQSRNIKDYAQQQGARQRTRSTSAMLCPSGIFENTDFLALVEDVVYLPGPIALYFGTGINPWQQKQGRKAQISELPVVVGGYCLISTAVG